MVLVFLPVQCGRSVTVSRLTYCELVNDITLAMRGIWVAIDLYMRNFKAELSALKALKNEAFDACDFDRGFAIGAQMKVVRAAWSAAIASNVSNLSK